MREGKITFRISFPGTVQESNILEMTGDEIVVYFKDSLTRREQRTAKDTTVTLQNYKTGETYTLVERPNEKVALKMINSKLTTISDLSYTYLPDLKLTNEKKKIAGYKCTKAIVTVNSYGEKKNMELWYTDEIALPNPTEYAVKGIPGYILEITFMNLEVPIKITCTSVEKTPVDNELLQLPADYTIKSMPDIMKPSED